MAAKLEISVETKNEIIEKFENDIAWYHSQIEKLSYLIFLIENDSEI